MTVSDEEHQRVVDAAVEMDRRRRKQVDLQRDAINRLTAGDGFDLVHYRMFDDLAAAQARLEAVADLVHAAPNQRSQLVRQLRTIVEDD